MAWNWDLRAVSGPPQIPGVTGLTPLAQGGMSQVYVGQDATGRRVAVKVMRSLDPASVARFQREAELLARFRAPEVVTAHSWGVTDECSYLVYALVEGETLDLAAAELDLPSRLELLLEITRAVGVAHAGGVVHRDLKPSNILVTPAGGVRLIDFGISIGLDQARLTQTGQLLGTPAYMPLERLSKSSAPDPREDVWSLGVVAYELLTGRLPYPSSTILDFPRRSQRAPALESAAGPEVEAVVLRGLSPAPADRYPTAGAMAEALELALSGGRGSRAPGAEVGVALAGLGLALALGIWGWRGLEPSSGATPSQTVASQTVAGGGDPRPPALPISPSPEPTPFDSSAAHLAQLPVALREVFAYGELNARWEAGADVGAELFEDEEGHVCLRVTSSSSGYVNTRRDAVALPDMNGIEALAVRLRVPEGQGPRAVRVLLGGARAGALLRKTIEPTTAWKTHYLPLRWLRPHLRSYPGVEELEQIYLSLDGKGVLEVQSVELLTGKRAMGLEHLVGLAFPRGESHLFLLGQELVAVMNRDGPPPDRDLQERRVILSLSRLRDSLGALASPKAIVLLLFADRETFAGFWRRLGARMNVTIRTTGAPTSASYMHLATAIYAPGDAAHLDCVEVAARAFLSRSLRLLSEPDWLFEGVALHARIEARGVGLAAYLAESPRRRLPLSQVIGGTPPEDQLWQVVLLMRWLQADPRAPIGFEELLRNFREEGDTDLERQLEAKGSTLEATEASWWAWVRATFPDFELAKK